MSAPFLGMMRNCCFPLSKHNFYYVSSATDIVLVSKSECNDLSGDNEVLPRSLQLYCYIPRAVHYFIAVIPLWICTFQEIEERLEERVSGWLVSRTLMDHGTTTDAAKGNARQRTGRSDSTC